MESRSKSESTPTKVATDVIIDMSNTSQRPGFRDPSTLVRNLLRSHARNESLKLSVSNGILDSNGLATQQPIRSNPNEPQIPCHAVCGFELCISTQYKENYTCRHSESRRPFTRERHSHRFSMFGPRTTLRLCPTFKSIEPFALFYRLMAELMIENP